MGSGAGGGGGGVGVGAGGVGDGDGFGEGDGAGVGDGLGCGVGDGDGSGAGDGLGEGLGSGDGGGGLAPPLGLLSMTVGVRAKFVPVSYLVVPVPPSVVTTSLFPPAPYFSDSTLAVSSHFEAAVV